MSAGAVPHFQASVTRPRRMLGFVLRSYRLELSKAIEYRGSLIGWALLGGAPLLASYILLQALYSDAGFAGQTGYSFSMAVTYQMIAHMLFTVMTGWSLMQTVSEEIRAGEMNRYLIRPIPYGLYRAIAFTGYNTVYVTILIVPAATVVLLLGSDFVFVSWTNVLLSLAAAALGYWLQFLIVFCYALLAFWWDEVSGIFYIYVGAARFVAGEMIPIDWFPAWAVEALSFTPFPWIVFFPVQVYLGRVDADAMARGFLTGGIWLVIMLCVASALWRCGIKKYCAFGG